MADNNQTEEKQPPQDKGGEEAQSQDESPQDKGDAEPQSQDENSQDKGDVEPQSQDENSQDKGDVEPQSQGNDSYYADGSSKESGDTDEQGYMKKVALQGGSGGGGYYADGSSKESGDTDEQGYMKKVAMPGQPSDKQKAREYKKSKRSGGVLRKLGSGKLGRYGKAAMLTAGLMAPGGPSGMSAFQGKEGMNDQADNIHKEQRISEEQIAANRKSPEFEPYDNQQIKTVDSAGNISTGQSQGSGGYYADGSSKESGDTDEQGRMKKVALQGGSGGTEQNKSEVKLGDEASMRRGLNQNKLQDRNIKDGTEKKGDTKQGDQVKEDKTLKSRWQKIQNERKNIKSTRAKIAGKIDVEGQGMAAASQAANKAIHKAYNQIFSIIEEVLLDLFFLIWLIWPIYFFLSLFRVILSMIGMMTIKIKGVEVKLVPGFSLNEALLRFFGFTVTGGIFVIEWSLIWFVYHMLYESTWWEKVMFAWNWFW